jgi:RNA polymerase sigma factor (sigma-70 family)
MLSFRSMGTAASDDLALVNASLNGDREAFAEIVTRYQALIASVAYSATGNLAQSEDIAQEAFVTAWTHLKYLREPGKLRSWLCGIARRVIANARRTLQREPAQGAAPLEAVLDTPDADALPVERAITHEEETILWRSLKQVPETYREPLILFYRENHSIERVAQALELSEEAVPQRLSRGRKLLAEQVAVFVEGALRQSAPGRSFTLGVLSALPAQMATAGAASATLAAVKGGAASKAASWLAIFRRGPLLPRKQRAIRIPFLTTIRL